MTKFWMACALASASIGITQGQTTKMPAPAKAVEDLVGRFEGEILSAARAMPADKYDFTPASLHIPGADFTKVRTFSEELTHVAAANYAIASNLTGKDPTVDLKTVNATKGKDNILAALQASFQAVHQAIATITPANQGEFVDDIGVGANQTKETEAAWVAVHGFDHYGQIVEYLRMNGIAPPPPAPVR